MKKNSANNSWFDTTANTFLTGVNTIWTYLNQNKPYKLVNGLDILTLFSTSTMKTLNVSLQTISLLGYPLAELKTGGFSVAELNPLYTLAKLKPLYTLAELKTVGFTTIELLDVGFTKSELQLDGFTFEQPSPVITSISGSSGQVIINFTQIIDSTALSITNYAYSLNVGEPFILLNNVDKATIMQITGNTYLLTISGLTNKNSYSFSFESYNEDYSLPSSRFASIYIRPTLVELLLINATKSDYILYNYTLQNLVGSALFALSKLQVAGYTLSELKLHFTKEALISSWKYLGLELNQNGIINNGINFIFLVISTSFDNKITAYKTYSENSNNVEVQEYNFYIEDKYYTNVLSTKPF